MQEGAVRKIWLYNVPNGSFSKMNYKIFVNLKNLYRTQSHIDTIPLLLWNPWSINNIRGHSFILYHVVL